MPFQEPVGTWDDVTLSSEAERWRVQEAGAAPRRKRSRRYDTYESEYDRGRLKKPLRQALAAKEAAAWGAPAPGRGGGRGRGRERGGRGW